MILFSGIVLLVSCANGQKQKVENESRELPAQVVLMKSQVQKWQIQLGKPQRSIFHHPISANGQLKVSPQRLAAVTSPIGATIKRILVTEGQRVQKGQVLAYISHPDLLDLQGRYLAAYHRMSYVAQEYRRQQKLYSAKVGSGKDFQQIQSEYRSLQGELNTVGSQLRELGINPLSLRKGRLITQIPLRCPISGTVEHVNAEIAQYADPQVTLFNIVNTDQVYADLLVFEKEIAQIRIGQTVNMTIPSAGSHQWKGKVVSIGKTIDDQLRAIHVRVSFIGPHTGLLSGMYVQARISTQTKSKQAIPSEGIVEEEGKKYVFWIERQQGQWIFRPLEVQIGQEEGGLTEVRTRLAPDRIWALDHAYELMSELKKEETGEAD